MRLNRYALASSLVLGSPVWGATIATAPLKQASGEHIECRAANVGRAPIEITSEGVGPDGSVFSKHAGTVEGGKAATTVSGVCNAPSGTFCVGYCRFTAKARRSIRGAAITSSGATGGPIVTLPAD